jgi:hypothetical protein
MHKFGLSSRYLGLLHKKAIAENAEHVRIILERVTLVKSLKNMFRQAMRKVELGDFNTTISKLLNCVFCNEQTLNMMDQVYSKDEIKD